MSGPRCPKCRGELDYDKFEELWLCDVCDTDDEE